VIVSAFPYFPDLLLIEFTINSCLLRFKGDLWGPLLVCLLLSIVLSITAPSESASLVFAAVFVIVWFGAAAVTINAQLLGGTISFFQSVCILGYCVFPLTLSAIGCLIMSFVYKNVRRFTIISVFSTLFFFLIIFFPIQIIIKLLIVAIGFIWSTQASVVFMVQVIKEERRTLAVYPVLFFYTFIGWMILLQ
jgi:hypothetical protein